ncbi:MAG: TlyA family RNA methyltransferase [Pseudomonadota bacterium]|nr:TlyA family RNA methyltransferase [Pseudomonadota bacterium]
MRMEKRLDRLMVDSGLVESRARAKFVFQHGFVTVNGVAAKKLSQIIDVKDKVEIIKNPNPWVSRAALKLDFALNNFNITNLNGIALDIGASTGGFTDVLLHYGCKKVFAVDVGRGQLHKKLREDQRVISFEGFDARNLTGSEIPEVDFIVCDTAFISLTKVLKTPLKFGKPSCILVALVKPQFEVGRKNISKKGIVRDHNLLENACKKVTDFLILEGWPVESIIECPVRGGGGAIEFLIKARKS